jgi:release factor glutamine methyltransferase
MTEAELLFTEIFNSNLVSLYTNRKFILDKDKSIFVSKVLKRRFSGEPIQYILGKTEFMGLEFKVTSDVFIPRPETEILVETVIKYAYRLSPIAYRILDLGTGSGCIAVSLAKLLSDIKISATDISQKAIEIAKYNAVLNNVVNKIEFLKNDLITNYQLPLPCRQAGITNYDVIVSNPPYIPSAEIDNLQPEVRYEPRIALDGGKDGLGFYRRIICQAPDYLKEDGFLILEIGFHQAQSVKNIFQKYDNFEIIEIVKDYCGIERVIVARSKYG